MNESKPAYDVWTMDAKGNSRRVVRVATLPEVRSELTSERRKGYIYVFKWPSANHSQPQGRYLWGCIGGRAHTRDLRAQVRECLRN